MKTRNKFNKFIAVTMSAAFLVVGFFNANHTFADNNTVSFESPTYKAGDINGQDGWIKTGSYDAAVVSNTYGIPSFGSQVLRISDATTSGSFGDQTFSKPLVNEAGETDALSDGQSGGTRQNHFEAQFDLASALSTLQPGMHLSVSPDRGDGARMSYLRFEDHSDGIHVYFDDVTDPGHVKNGESFNETDIATISRAPHTIKFSMNFIDGPDNDIVKIYIDGNLVETGTSWEDYYRFDTESNPTLADNSRTVDSLLFRESGTQDPANAGNGFLIDNFSSTTSTLTKAPTTNSATAVSTSDATLNGTNGDYAATDSSFWWGTTPVASFSTPADFPASNWNHDNGLGPVAANAAFSNTVASLTPNTTYYYAAWVYVDGAWHAGQVQSFTTPVVQVSSTTVVHQSDLETTTSIPTAVTNNSGKWFFYNDTNDTINNTLGSFVNGPATAPAGVGSAQMTDQANPNDRLDIATYGFQNTKLSDITNLGFSAYSHSGVAGATESPYLVFNVSFSGSNSFQKRLVYVPSANGSVPQDTWTTYDTINGGAGLWTWSGYASSGNKWPDGNTSEYRTWTDINTAFPSARVLPVGGLMGVRVGEPGPKNYTGNVDKFIFGTAAEVKTFDFEPTPSTVKVTIDKYINGTQATTDNTNSASFPMHAIFPGGEGDYALSPSGFNNPNAYEATTSDMASGANYSTYETASSSCTAENPYSLVGYSTGDTLADAAGTTPTTDVPAFTGLTSDKFIIVWNKTCPPAPTLLSPSDNTTLSTATWTSADWSDVTDWSGPISYIYESSNSASTNPDGSFTSPVYVSGSLSSSEIPTTGTPAGTYYWHVRAVDSLGNKGPWAQAFKTTVDNTVATPADTTPPTVTVTPEAGSNLSGTVTFTITVTDNQPLDGSKLTKIWTYLYDSTGAQKSQGANVDLSSGTGTFIVDTTKLDDGNAWLDVGQLSDASGNLSGPVDNYFKDYIINNTVVTPPTPTKFKIHIFKYEKNGDTTAQVPNDSSDPSFPMIAKYSIAGVGTNLDPGDGFVLGDGGGVGGSDNGLKYAANTIPLSAGDQYGTNEVTDGSVVVAPDSTSCPDGKYKLVGYETGATLTDAEHAESTTTSPSFSDIDADHYVIVVNEKCPTVIVTPADTTAPSVPVLLSPATGTTLSTNEFDFTWNASTDDSNDAITYEYHASQDPTETDGVLTNGLWTSPVLTSPTIHSSGAADGTWYWQVRAIDPSGNKSAWSDIWNVVLNTATATPNDSAPVISAEQAGNPTSNSVTITWTTDHPATSRVVYDTTSQPTPGTAPNYGYANSTSETDDSPMVTNHSVTVTGLNPNTTYYFREVSHGSPEAVGNEVTSTTTDTGIIPPQKPTTGSFTVTKNTVNGDGTFNFTGDHGIEAFSISTTSGTGEHMLNNLAPNTYTITEGDLPTGWSETDNGCTNIVITAGATEACTITNTFTAPVENTGGGSGGTTSGGNSTTLFSSQFQPTINTPGLPQVLGAQSYHFTLNLHLGSTGNEVMELQKFLNNAGYGPLVVDGKFGKLTKAALIKFQLANGLAGDGIVGPLTRAVLNK